MGWEPETDGRPSEEKVTCWLQSVSSRVASVGCEPGCPHSSVGCVHVYVCMCVSVREYVCVSVYVCVV